MGVNRQFRVCDLGLGEPSGATPKKGQPMNLRIKDFVREILKGQNGVF